MTAHHEPKSTRTLADAQRRWKDEPPITITLPRGDAWLLLTAAQLRRGDVDIAGDLAQDLKRVGRAVQEAVCTPHNPDLYMVAEAGWNPTFDTVLASGDQTQPTTRYAFVVENSTDGTTWMQDLGKFDGRTAGTGVEHVHDLGPADYARRVLTRRFAQLRGDDSYDWEDLWYRSCVWDIARSTAYRWGTSARHEPEPDLVAQWLKANECAPHAAEIRTPTQVIQEIERSHFEPSPMR